MIKISKDKRYKLLGIFLYVLISCLVVLLTKPVYILSIIIVLVPPALVNFLWLKKSKKKILVFSIISTILFAFAAELSSRLANSWDVQSVLPRLFGILPLENILFAFLNIFWVLSFYEYFVDRDFSSKIQTNQKYRQNSVSVIFDVLQEYRRRFPAFDNKCDRVLRFASHKNPFQTSWEYRFFIPTQ